jgi:very-short-patch-repair endonuclease
MEKDVNNQNGSGNLSFVKDLATYFMEFLETDFHKRKSPKRAIQLRNKDNLLIGFNLNKYPTFNNLVWKTINHAFSKENSMGIVEKGVYKTNIPNNLLDLIKLQVKKVSDKQIKKIIKGSAEQVEKNSILYKKDFDRAFMSSLDEISQIVKKEIVIPFVENLEKPLGNLELGDENSIYLMEEELTSVLLSLLEKKLSEIIKRSISGEKINADKELSAVFDPTEVKNNINAFFENFRVTDLFNEIFEIDRNKNILDKQEFYLYFCDIAFNKTKYPIFYIPFDVIKKDNLLNIEFDSQVYINKKALEYIVQEFNEENNKKGNPKSISERIIYLSQHKEDFRELINSVLVELINFFDLDSKININNPAKQLSKSFWTRVSNSCYIVLFDKSDEAMINDYEDILQKVNEGDSVIGEIFNKLIDDFIRKNPEPFNPEIEEEWANTETEERLVFRSPIPLNSEQLQILSAVRKDNCKYITVEGPPGTGKSHTITAIVFDAILKNQSVLVLSDKKEALDVVEDKITETMDKVRYDKNFQNPILRLGKTGSTYSQILSNNSIGNIKTHYSAFKKDEEKIESNIKKISNSLKEDIEAESLGYKDISIHEVQELFGLEGHFSSRGYVVDIEEVLKQPESAVEIEELRVISKNLADKILDENGENKFFSLINSSFKEFDNTSKFLKLLAFLEVVLDGQQKVQKVYGESSSLLSLFREFAEKDLKALRTFLDQYKELRSWFFGYLFVKNKVEKLNIDFKKRFPRAEVGEPQERLDDLNKVLELLEYIKELEKESEKIGLKNIDFIKLTYHLLKDKESIELIKSIISLKADIDYLTDSFKKYENTLNKAGVEPEKLRSLCKNKFTVEDELDFNKLIRYINLRQKIEKGFKNLPASDYVNQMKILEDLITAQMTYKMDGRLLNFYEHNKNDATAIREIIRKKQRFPKDQFLKLKEAFPCILAGIRDYAEYIPLEPEIFDLVIIDEASQVSISQAFPALIRAKKVLILGDKKQFSNVKTAQARTNTNREFLNNLADSFKKNISDDPAKIVRLEKFNIKTSILEFFEFITNYNTQLLKHFRGYKEIISYSNKYFYQDNLQVMKIRGKTIDDVLRFSFTEHDGKIELLQNSNMPEVQFIISELKKMKEVDSNLSAGIITPHTNQQKLLIDEINKIPEREYFFDKLRLKIMTFDTCQGEERDIIFYSMVATKDEDRLWGVFIKNLGDVNIEEDGKIKVQRLNVGFSRAKERMHFVLSKPIEDYNGSVGEALRHYQFMLKEAKKERSVEEVDKNSKMEPEVMNWFYQTNFWKENKDSIEFIPQFEIGKYLRQLDRTYNHPCYKVDFLLVYKDELHEEHKIIIEYDGFREHFENIDEVNELNYDHYLSDDDMYREKVLEGYGYKFLRINKFNIGNNPIATLDDRVANLLKKKNNHNKLLSGIHNTIEGLQNGDMKECPKCKEIREYKDFRDPDLITGYGRFCMHCKGYTLVEKSTSDNHQDGPVAASDKECPRCGSGMILRTGRYGKFYGCSKYPYCRGTRQL